MLRSLLLVGNSCVNTSKAWLWILENAPSSVFRFILSTVIIYKQRVRRLSLCCANWSRTLSTLIFFSLWVCSIANDERRSSVIVFRSGVFNLLIKLKLPSAAHDDTGYVKSVFTATQIPLISYSRVECSISYIQSKVKKRVKNDGEEKERKKKKAVTKKTKQSKEAASKDLEEKKS